MLVIGITNKLKGNFRLFMWEYDNINLFDVLEEANFLSQVFDIDIYVLKSSSKHYHMVSFDILDLETVSRIQNWVMHDTDYLNIKDMSFLDDKGLWNTLRIGKKGKKPKPSFVKAFYSKKIRPKSLQHYKIYKHFCGIPEEKPPRKYHFFNVCSVQIAVYNTGIGAKPKRIMHGTIGEE